MDAQSLKDLARYQSWADAQHWAVIHANPALSQDSEIRERITHMWRAAVALQTMARGQAVDPAQMKTPEPGELESALAEANSMLAADLETMDLNRSVEFPRGPQGPFLAPAGAVLFQALLHSQHHRGQNASRMRALGVMPPLTDFIIWYALGKP